MSEQPRSVAETLRRAKERIANPKQWTKGAMAKISKRADDEFGAVDPQSPKAAAWCAIGAIRHVDGPYEYAAIKALGNAVHMLEHGYRDDFAGEGTVIDLNDATKTRHRDVMRAFDNAIADVEKQEIQP